MPVTFKVSEHHADPFPCGTAKNAKAVTNAWSYEQWMEKGAMLQTSVTRDVFSTLIGYKNGFVHTIVDAYGKHRHLTLRYILNFMTWLNILFIPLPLVSPGSPDDVWIAILSQLSF